jgi:hypothetical protein
MNDMAEVTFAHALEVVRALSLEDQARLRQWLAAQEGQHASQPENDSEPPPKGAAPRRIFPRQVTNNEETAHAQDMGL